LWKRIFKSIKAIRRKEIKTNVGKTDGFSISLCRNCWQQKYRFLTIDKDSTLTNGRYRKVFNEFTVPRSGYRYRYTNVGRMSTWLRTKIREREKVMREIRKTVHLTRKKHRVLKTGKIEEDIATKNYFKHIISRYKRLLTTLACTQ